MNPSNPKSAAYAGLDAWRGIASLWVVVFHAASEIGVFYPALLTRGLYPVAMLGHLGVQIFFVISGYCIANAGMVTLSRGKGWWSFTRARLRRIYPPMWISLGFFAVIKMGVSIAMSRGWLGKQAGLTSDFFDQGFLYYFANLSLTQIVFRQEWLSRVCWTLCYEIAFYLAVAILIVISDRLLTRRLLLNALHTITAIALACLLASPQSIPFPFDLWPQFGLGVLVFDLLNSADQLRARIWAAVLGLETMAFIAFWHIPIGYQNNPSREQFIICLGLAALLIALHRWDGKLSLTAPIRWMAEVGKFSYSLYLIHLLVITLLVKVIGTGIKAEHHLLYMLLLTAASVGAGWVFYLLFERHFIPSMSKPPSTKDANATSGYVDASGVRTPL